MRMHSTTRDPGRAGKRVFHLHSAPASWLAVALGLGAGRALAQPAVAEPSVPPATEPGMEATTEPGAESGTEPGTAGTATPPIDPALAAAIDAAVAARVEAEVPARVEAAVAAALASAGAAPQAAGESGEAAGNDELAALIGEDLAAELRADEAQVTGRVAAEPAYLAGTDATVGGRGRGGEVGPSNLMNPAISLIGTFAASYFTDDAHPPRGGHVPTSTGIHVMEAELGVEAAVDPYFYLRGFFLFGLTFFETEEVYAETLRLPGGLKVRAGQMLAPFGRSNQTHPHVWEFVDATLPHQRFLSGEGLRAPSLELSWLVPVPFFLKVSGWAGMPGETPPAGSTPDEKTWGKDRDYDFLYLGRLETHIPFSDAWSMALGASAATGPAGQGAGTRSDLFGGDLFLRYKPVEGASYFEFDVTVEGAFRQRQFPGNHLADWAVAVEPAFRLAKQWRMALRADVAEGDLTRGDTMTGPARDFGEERGALSITYFPTEFSLLRLQGTLSHPHGEAWTGPEWGGEIFLQASYALGAHGAHPF